MLAFCHCDDPLVRTYESSDAKMHSTSTRRPLDRINLRTSERSTASKFDVTGARQYERLGVRIDGKIYMSVLTVAGQKGGSGKSTLVRNLAIHFALEAYKVGIVDADLIQQHSSEFFADRRREAGREVWTGREDIPGLSVKVWDRSSPDIPEASIVIAPQADQDSIGEIIQALAESTDVVMCDLQGSASVAMLHAIHYADLVLIPVQPSNDDLKSCHSTARHVVQAGRSARRDIPYRIVISRASTGFRPEVEKVVEEALEIAKLPRLKTPVFERTAFKRASFSRIAPIFEDPNGGAAINLKAVYAEVRDTLAEIVKAARENG
jgi:chromosome partitioning protein